MSKPKKFATSGGVESTDALIERLANELCPRRRGRPPMGSAAAEVVVVRLLPELKQATASRAEQEQTSLSEIIREALRRYLA